MGVIKGNKRYIPLTASGGSSNIIRLASLLNGNGKGIVESSSKNSNEIITQIYNGPMEDVTKDGFGSNYVKFKKKHDGHHVTTGYFTLPNYKLLTNFDVEVSISGTAYSSPVNISLPGSTLNGRFGSSTCTWSGFSEGNDITSNKINIQLKYDDYTHSYKYYITDNTHFARIDVDIDTIKNWLSNNFSKECTITNNADNTINIKLTITSAISYT